VKNDILYLDPNLPIDMSLSSDPYPPEEIKHRLTRKILEILLPKGFKVQITTKSNLFTRDLDLISKYNVTVSITITTLDNALAHIIEPGSPKPSERLKALEKLSEFNVPFSVRVDPIIPFLNDDEDELRELVRIVVDIGAKHVVTSTYKARPDNFKRMVEAFSELEDKWMKLYYPKGKMHRSYAYLPLVVRKKLLGIVTSAAEKLGISYATCREGIVTKEFFNAKSCDGTHLIPNRIPYKEVVQRIDKLKGTSNTRLSLNQ